MLNYSVSLWIIWWIVWLLVGKSSKSTIYQEPFRERFIHLFPLIGGVIFIFSGLVIAPTVHWENQAIQFLGLTTTTIGLSIACWSRISLGRNWSGLVVIKDGHNLIDTGPYSVVRHPIYTGLILAMAGSTLTAASIIAVAGLVLIMTAFIVKANHEEELLQSEFGDDYLMLCDRVPYKLFPSIY